jgi:hypothetical protein
MMSSTFRGLQVGSPSESGSAVSGASFVVGFVRPLVLGLKFVSWRLGATGGPGDRG